MEIEFPIISIQLLTLLWFTAISTARREVQSLLMQNSVYTSVRAHKHEQTYESNKGQDHRVAT